MQIHQEIVCPTCNQKDTWQPGNCFKPFCSARCKLIDLGEWANETRVIPGASITSEYSKESKEDDIV